MHRSLKNLDVLSHAHRRDAVSSCTCLSSWISSTTTATSIIVHPAKDQKAITHYINLKPIKPQQQSRLHHVCAALRSRRSVLVGGLDWHNIQPVGANQWTVRGFYLLDCGMGGTLFAASSGARDFFKSSDNASWTEVNSGLTNVICEDQTILSSFPPQKERTLVMKPTILAIIAAGFLLNSQCYAQEGAEQSQDDVNRWWITLGAGWATGAPEFEPQLFSEVSSLGLSLSFSYQFGPHVISFRAAGDANYTGGLLLFFGTGETSSISDIALLYGRSDKGRASLAVGVGFVERKSRQKYILGVPISPSEKQTGRFL